MLFYYLQQLKKQYKTFDEFEQKYQVPETLVESIRTEGTKQKIQPKDDDELSRTLPYLRKSLKAQVARDLWGTNEFFRCWNENDDIVLKALVIDN